MSDLPVVPLRLDLYPFELWCIVDRVPVRCDAPDYEAQAFTEAWRVGQTEIGDMMVSTVFLGIGGGRDGKPPRFESMILGGPGDYQERCDTWDEAEAMHVAAVAHARRWVARAEGERS